MISIRFVAANDLISFGVRRGEYGFPWSHVEFVLDDGTIIGAHFRTGVARTAMDGSWTTSTQTVQLPASDAQKGLLEAFLMAQVGKPYDLEAIVAIATSTFLGARDWRNDKAWMCSELVTATLEHAGLIAKLDDEASHITPRDLKLILSARQDAIWAPVVAP